MEKTENKFYKAVSILCYIFGALASISLLSIFIGVIGSAVGVYSGDLGYAYPIYAISVMYLVLCGVFAIAEIALLFVEAVMFGKLSSLTDEEAANTYNKALTWCIVSFFFGGLLIGGLALGGLLTVQAKQKDRYISSQSQKNAQTNSVAPEQPAEKKEEETSRLTVENMEITKQRLQKLEELKAMNAVTEEEYNSLRKEIVSSLTVDKKEDNEKQKRLAKLETLRQNGTLTDEEFEALKNKLFK